MIRPVQYTVEILRALTIKLTRAKARARSMARARARALANTRDRPRLRAMVSSRARARVGLGSVFTFKRPDRFCRRTKFNVTGPVRKRPARDASLYNARLLLRDLHHAHTADVQRRI